MKTFFFIGMLFGCSFVLKAQSQLIETKTKKDYHLKGDVKQVIMSDKDKAASEKLEFTPEGRLQYEGSANLSYGITYAYDKAGRLFKYRMFTSDSSHSIKTYQYNAQGLLTKYTNEIDNKEPYYETYQYDTNGKIRQQSNLGMPYCEFRNTYDAKKGLSR